MIFFNYASFLDLFKSPLTLLFNKKRFISTKFGFFCSLAIISILIVMASKSDLFEKALPQILTSNLPVTHRPLLKFSNKILAIGVQDDTYFQGFIDPTVYNLKITNYFYTANSSGGYIKTIYEKKYHICSESDFDIPETFTSLGLANNFCLEKEDNNLELEGFFDESVIKFGSIELYLCNNQTSNETCQTIDEMYKVLNGKTFNIYFEDTIIDSKNYEDPIKHTIVNEYRYIDLSFRKNLDIFFQDITLNSDDGWLFSNFSEFTEIGYVFQDSDFFSVDADNMENSRFAINLYSDKKVQSLQRTYTKVGDLLARLGGIMQSLMLIAYVFIYFEHSLFLKNTILNSLFVFQTKEQNLSRKQSKNNLFDNKEYKYVDKLSSSSRKQTKNFPICPQNIFKKFTVLESELTKPNSNPLQKFNNFNIEDTMTMSINPGKDKNWFKSAFFARKKKILEYQAYKEETPKTQKLNFGMIKYFILTIKSHLPFFKMTFEEELYKKSEKIYEKELDYIEILKKLQDVEKLKKILLTPKQIKLFEFLSKPMLHLNELTEENRSMNSINLDNKENKNLEDLKKVIDYYENLKSEGILSEVDKRLLRIFNDDIKNFN